MNFVCDIQIIHKNLRQENSIFAERHSSFIRLYPFAYTKRNSDPHDNRHGGFNSRSLIFKRINYYCLKQKEMVNPFESPPFRWSCALETDTIKRTYTSGI